MGQIWVNSQKKVKTTPEPQGSEVVLSCQFFRKNSTSCAPLAVLTTIFRIGKGNEKGGVFNLRIKLKTPPYHTVCNECQQVIDGTADQHIRETGHSGYSTNVPITDEVLVSEGYTHEVTDTPAYDETVADEMVCTLCGETRPLDGTVQ